MNLPKPHVPLPAHSTSPSRYLHHRSACRGPGQLRQLTKPAEEGKRSASSSWRSSFRWLLGSMPVSLATASRGVRFLLFLSALFAPSCTMLSWGFSLEHCPDH